MTRPEPTPVTQSNALPLTFREFFKQPISLISGLSLVTLFFFTRLYNLTLHGLQYDEASYLYWGQVIAGDWSQRYIGAPIGGKQPLHSWLVSISEKFISDPVFAGRFVSVIAGFLSVVAIWLLAERLFSTRVAFLSVLLYIVCPFTLNFDRIALIDSLLSAESLWTLYFGVRLVQNPDLPRTFGLAASFGAALLTKSVARYFPLLLPFALLFYMPKQLTKGKVTNWLVMSILGLGLGYGIYHLLFGSTNAAVLVDEFEQQVGKFTLPISMLLTFPWQKWWANTVLVLQWFAQLVTIPISLVGLIGIIFSPKMGGRAMALSAWIVLPILGQIFIAAIFYERYILFTIPIFLILTACLLEDSYLRLYPRISTKTLNGRPLAPIVGLAILSILLIPTTLFDIGILTDLRTANRVASGYYGLYRLRDSMVDKTRSNPVYVLANHDISPVEDGSAVLLRDKPNIKLLRVYPMNGKLTIIDPVSNQLYSKDLLKGKDTYYIFEIGKQANNWLDGRIELVETFSNETGNDSAVGLYRVTFDGAFW